LHLIKTRMPLLFRTPEFETLPAILESVLSTE
jgi:hypothetical protein